METFLFHRSEYNRLYNCSFYNISQIPVENRTHVVLGVTVFSLAVFYQLMYIPCIISISKHLQNPAYKFMFFIGIVDMMCMPVNGLLTGYFAASGVVYCSHPILIYVAGGLGEVFWMAETSAAMLLAINRCVEMWSPKMAYCLYRDHLTWYWLCIPIFYGTYIFLFAKPVLFSGVYMSWFFNPHIGYYDDFGKTYYNNVHTVHNLMVVILLTSIYGVFMILLAIKSAAFKTIQTSRRSNSQKMSFLQVFIISVVNGTAASVYVIMQFAKITDVLIVIGTFTWLTAHGMPSIIYTTMNRTIRNDTINMMRRLMYRIGCTRTVVITQQKTTTNESFGDDDLAI